MTFKTDSIQIELNQRSLEANISIILDNDKFPAKLTYTYNEDEHNKKIYEPFQVKIEPLFERLNLQNLKKIKVSSLLAKFSAVHEDFCSLKCFKIFSKCNLLYFNNQEMSCSIYEASNSTREEDTDFQDFQEDYRKVIYKAEQKNTDHNLDAYFKIYKGTYL